MGFQTDKSLSAEEWLKADCEFMCQATDTLNTRMHPEFYSCDEANKEIIVRYPLQAWEKNGIGTLHGGIISSMMDLTMSMSIFVNSRQSIPPTITMTINYLRPVAMKDYILIRSKMTSLGRKNATAYCEAIIPETGKIACTAIGTYAIVPAPEEKK